jgi:hypothetical protein
VPKTAFGVLTSSTPVQLLNHAGTAQDQSVVVLLDLVEEGFGVGAAVKAVRNHVCIGMSRGVQCYET